MRQFKHSISILLCMCMTFLFCGCGKENSTKASAAFKAETATEAVGTGVTKTELSEAEPVSYQAEKLQMPGQMDDALNIWVKDDMLYLYGRSFSDETIAGGIIKLDFDGNTLGRIQLPEDGMTDIQLCEDGGLWVMTPLWGEDQSYQGTRFAQASEPYNVEREFMMDKNTYPESPQWMLLDEDRETLYVFDWTTMYALDYDGNELFRLSSTMGGTFYDPCFTADGQLAVLERGDNGQVVLLLDADHPAWSGIELSVEGRGLYGGVLYDLYIRDEQLLYGVDLATGELTPLLRFLDTNMGSDIWDVCALEDGQFVMLANMQLYVVSPGEDSEVVTLTLASVQEPALIEGAVLDFNTSQDKYKIVVRDYSQYNTAESDAAGLEQLGLDIAAGDIPDLYDLRGIPVERYAALGLLEDLYPYLDADEEFSREDIIPSFLSAMETDGRLYFLAPHFGIRTLLAAEDTLSRDWTFSELLSTANGADPFGGSITRYQLLRDMAGGSGSPFVDWETGQCSFHSQEFIDLLTLAALLPTEEPGEYGEPSPTPALTIELVGSPISLLAASASVGGTVDAAGFPGSDGARYLLEPVREILGMSAQGAHKDGAWAFLRTMLTEKKQRENSIPITRTAYGTVIAEEKECMEGGMAIELPGADGEWREYPYTAEYLDTFEALVNSATGIYEYDSALMEILWSEAQGFFAGDRSAEDTAKNIQSRVSLYMAEQG